MAVEIEGLRTTIRNLERLGVAVSDLKAAFKKIGSIITADAQRQAPRKSGALAGSIRPSNTKNKAVVRAGSARVPYAGVQHYGWPARNIEGHPYLTNAVANKQVEAVNTLDEELANLIKQYGLK